MLVTTMSAPQHTGVGLQNELVLASYQGRICDHRCSRQEIGGSGCGVKPPFSREPLSARNQPVGARYPPDAAVLVALARFLSHGSEPPLHTQAGTPRKVGDYLASTRTKRTKNGTTHAHTLSDLLWKPTKSQIVKHSQRMAKKVD